MNVSQCFHVSLSVGVLVYFHCLFDLGPTDVFQNRLRYLSESDILGPIGCFSDIEYLVSLIFLKGQCLKILDLVSNKELKDIPIIY